MDKVKLLKLASFLRELPPKEFNFGDVVTEWDDKRECGSICCAIGWTPKVFPDEVQWWQGSSVELIDRAGDADAVGYVEVAALLFDISQNDAINLFSPRGRPRRGLPPCNADATPCEVADLIELYVKLH